MLINRADKKVDELEQEIAELESRNNPAVIEEVITTEEVVDEPAPSTKEEETFKKRYGDLRRHSQKVEKELKDKVSSLEEKLSSTSVKSDVPTDPEQVKEWIKKYPQVAAVIASIADERAGKTLTSTAIDSRLKEIEEANVQLLKDREVAKIKRIHEDFDEIVSDDKFHDWVETQPAIFQNLVYENGKSDDVIWLLNLYKKGKQPVVNEDKLAAAPVRTSRATPTTDNGKRRFTESQVEKMTTVEYEKNEQAIMEAMRSGAFVYDLTGGAR